MVSMALAYASSNVNAAGGARQSVVYNRGGALTGHAHTRPYTLDAGSYYAIDDGQNGGYPNFATVPNCSGSGSFQKLCATQGEETQRFNNALGSGFAQFVCWNGQCWTSSSVPTLVGAAGTEEPIRASYSTQVPATLPNPGNRRGGYWARKMGTLAIEVRYSVQLSGGVPGTWPPGSIVNISADAASYCNTNNPGQLTCRFPMLRFQYMLCNIGFQPQSDYFADRPLLSPPHTRNYEQEMPCHAIPAPPSSVEKSQNAVNGIPGLVVTGSNPKSTCNNPEGDPCIPSTGEEIFSESDFEFAGHSFGRTYRSSRKGRSFGFIDDNWTHTWSARVLTSFLMGGGAGLNLSTPTGDIVHFTMDSEASGLKVYRADSKSNWTLRELSPAGSGWRWTRGGDEYQDFDNYGRLIRIGNRTDTSQTLSFTYLKNIHYLDWAWWSIYTVTDARGRQLRFDYDLMSTYQPRLLQVVLASDPAAPALVQYSYWDQSAATNVFWRLKRATYPDGRVRQYKYEDHEPNGAFNRRQYLASVDLGTATTIDTSPIRFASFKYDVYGRVVDAYQGGNLYHDRVQLAYFGNDDTLPTSVAVTKALGDVRTYQIPALGQSAQLNALHFPSTIGDAAGTLSRAYNQSNASRCTSAGAADWRVCREKDRRGYVTLYQYSGMHLIRTVEGLTENPDGSLAATPETRTTMSDWSGNDQLIQRRVCQGDTLCDAFAIAPTLVKKSSWVYDSSDRLTHQCEHDVTDAVSSNFSCGGSPLPAGVHRTVYSYCTSTDPDCWTGYLRTIDGPRTDVSDISTLSYYKLTNETGCESNGPCNRSGDLQTVTNALGQVTTFNRYDRRGRVKRLTDPNGVATEINYDAQGRVISRRVLGATPAEDALTTISYVPETGLVNVMTLPDGSYMDYDYDAAQRVTSIRDNLNNRIEYKRDAAGKVVVEKTYENTTLVRRVAHEFDTLGRLINQRDALTAAGAVLPTGDLDDQTKGRLVLTNLQYDGNGNRTQSMDGLLRDTDTLYDPLNRVKQVQDALRPNCPMGNTACGNTYYSYDAADSLRTVTDPNGLLTIYTYDGLQQLDALNSPDTGITTYLQDQAGNVTRKTDFRGVRTDYSYDASNRLTSTTYPLGDTGKNSYFYYDESAAVTGCANSFPVGRRTRMVDASGTTYYCYDRRGNVTKKRQVVGSKETVIEYGYTLADRLRSVKYPDDRGTFTVTYGRDQAGRVQSIEVDGTTFATISHYAFGPVKTIAYADGYTQTKTYDANYQIDSITSDRPNGLNIDYAVDVIGRIQSITQAGAGRSFEYDPLDRLTEVRTGGDLIDQYTYDATGNRTSAKAGTQAAKAYSYPANSHRLQSIGGVGARQYDAMGNTIFVPELDQNFAFDDRGRMTTVSSNSHAWEYRFELNGLGERTSKSTVTGVATVIKSAQYLYNESGAIATIQDIDPATDGVRYRSVIYLDDVPVGIIDTGTVLAIETDHLGTPRVVAAPDGVLWRWELVTGTTSTGGSNAFGERLPNEDVDGDGKPYVFELRFPGQIHDPETGLHYNYFRDYEPGTGRYVESDPIGLAGGASTYGFVAGSPLRFSDPQGLCRCLYYAKSYPYGTPNFAPWFWETYDATFNCTYHCTSDEGNPFNISVDVTVARKWFDDPNEIFVCPHVQVSWRSLPSYPYSAMQLETDFFDPRSSPNKEIRDEGREKCSCKG
ncbi:MAG: RHS repeat-associated core domain-containing protein [Lysobacterales bacterium]